MKLLTHNLIPQWSQNHGYPTLEEGINGFHPICLKCNGYGSIQKYNLRVGFHFDDCPDCNGVGFANFIVIR